MNVNAFCFQNNHNPLTTLDYPKHVLGHAHRIRVWIAIYEREPYTIYECEHQSVIHECEQCATPVTRPGRLFTLWSETLSPKGNLQNAIGFMALCSANLVQFRHSEIREVH